MTHTSERRRTCWKLQVRAQPGVEQNGLWTWHARQLPFLPGHSNSIRTPFCIGALVYAAHAADIPVENGKLNKVHSGSSDRTKARSGISSGMIYLTRSVLIRAYYMRDREPRRAAAQPSAVWPYASTYHLRLFGSVPPIVLAIVPFSHSILSRMHWSDNKTSKEKKSREDNTEKYFTYSFQIVSNFK